MDNTQDKHLPVARNIKIGFFHLGSGMADVLTTGVWNRIMITDVGLAATPVGLLVSLRYFLSPLGIWAGRISDRYAIAGYRRLVWVWLGRLMMALSVFGLGWQTAQLVDGAEATGGVWAILGFSLLLFSLGNAISGSTFLALIYDRSPENQRGRAVGIVWTFLLIGFTIGGIGFGSLLSSDKSVLHELFLVPDYVPAEFGLTTFTGTDVQNLFIIAGVLLASLWFFSLVGEERRLRKQEIVPIAPSESDTSVMNDLKLVWESRPMRYFFWFLVLSMMFAFSQDLILEPFAGDVFNMDAEHTTRFAGYWGSMAILGTIGFLFLSRRYKWLTNSAMSHIGVATLIVAFGIFALSGFAQIRPLVTVGLVVLGLGLGFWNVGTLGLMMDMSPAGRAGTFLGFWTLVVTLGRGLGVSMSGPVRDILINMGLELGVAYGLVFALGGMGLCVSWWALSQINAKEIVPHPTDTATILVGAMD